MTIFAERKDLHCHDTQCAAVLCQTDGEFIYFLLPGGIEGSASAKVIAIPCPRATCETVTFWHRLKAPGGGRFDKKK